MAVGFFNLVVLLSLKFPGADLLILIPVLMLALVSIGTTIGYAHRKIQLRTDQDSAFETSHLAAKVMKVELKAIQGTATKEEISWCIDLLTRIEEDRV
jgi:hypothetical protein